MKHIQIKTNLPNREDIKLLKEINKYEANSMQGQLPIVWDRAIDCNVFDKHGNKFLDFTSTICVTNTGHGNSDVKSAIQRCINNSLLHTYTFPSEIRAKFLKKLVTTCYPGGKAFLLSAGTEATDCAIKLIRLYQKQNNRDIIISFNGAMHGRTMCAEMLKGLGSINKWFSSDFNMFHLSFPDKKSDFNQAIAFLIHNGLNPNRIAGFMIESYQGWSASFFPDKYIQDLYKFAKEREILICFDEIQGGFGRTGKMFSFEHYKIKPDLICIGKGISGSVPLSGVIGKKDILDTLPIGSMSSTHSANPLACSVGLANLEYIEHHRLIENSNKLGIILHKELKKIWKDVRGKGLLAALVCKNKDQADKIVWECFKKGLLLIWTHRESVKIAPPLTITEEALIEGISIIKKVII